VDVKTGSYPPGRHFTGVGYYFITIPRTYQNVETSIHARTSDGLALTLDASFQYRFEKLII